jgi:hypothetical protein
LRGGGRCGNGVDGGSKEQYDGEGQDERSAEVHEDILLVLYRHWSIPEVNTVISLWQKSKILKSIPQGLKPR